ncbi:glutathione S-transferase family protein [Hoeflea sp. WL0058]|uniref:Glutathione S-transferase family protein n=1 Tax=Flavimaribacter sediminis TaxID=2865987 RepID=A0AAE3D2W1_9HYPH|nr:glutathione S-transferase family protein [Flavimaribacter sediminis]MBW8639592.1 glutathione S-transferase family protein [Flavimaribacter sediminis]
MKLYNADLSPNALRVRAVAFELDIELDIIDVDVFKGGTKTKEYLALNPNGKVPVLVDGDFVLWESRAINVYLAGVKPERNLYPDDLQSRALVDQWSYWQAIHLGPAMQRVAFERMLKPMFGMGETDETNIEQQLKEIAQFLPVLDCALAGKEWIIDDLSLADFALASTFMYRDPCRISLDETANVDAWIKRLEARASWQKAVAPILAFGRK